MLEQARELDPKNQLAPLYLARVYLAIGDELETTSEGKLKRFNQGLEMARKAQAIKRTSRSEYWIGANMGRIGQTKGVLNSLFMVPELEQHFNAAIELDPNNAFALASMAEMNLELPWPKGDNDKALEFARRARKADPRLTYAMLTEAKVLIALGREEEAKKVCQEIVDIQNPRYPMDYYTGELQQAKKFLKEL